MNKAEIKSYLKEREVRPVSEKILDYMASHIGSVPFATMEQITYDLQATPEEMQAFFNGLGFESFMDFKAYLRQANYFESATTSSATRTSTASRTACCAARCRT